MGVVAAGADAVDVGFACFGGSTVLLGATFFGFATGDCSSFRPATIFFVGAPAFACFSMYSTAAFCFGLSLPSVSSPTSGILRRPPGKS